MRKTNIGGAAAGLVLVLLSGCQQKPDEAAIAECWGPDAKEMVLKLSRQSIEEKIEDVLKSSGRPVTPDGRRNLDSRLQINVDKFYTSSVDRTSNAAHCSADISVTLARPDGKQLVAGPEAQEFDIFQGESGRMYSLPQTLPLQRLVTTLDTNQETQISPDSDSQ